MSYHLCMITIRPFRAMARALLLAPFYFFLLTVFGLWSWRSGSPYALLRPIRTRPDAWNTFVLRTAAHRLLLRDDRLLRDNLRRKLDFYRLKRWIRSPWFVTWRHCARFTSAEMKRNSLSGVSTALTIYGDALVDSYRYANGTMHRDWFDLDRRVDGAFHYPNEHHIRVSCYLLNHKLNPDMPIEQRHYDKAAFHRICESHGLPTIPVYAAFENGKLTRHSALPEAPLVSKPCDLAEGNGVFSRWTPAGQGSSGEIQFRDDDGSTHTATEILELLTRLSKEGPYLLQSQVFNHQGIRELAGTSTLCSVRIPTCCFPDGRVVALPWAFIRMPTVPGAAVDNMTRGSVAFPIDLDSGRMQAGGKFGLVERFDSHPVTGKPVTGVKLPYWQETLDLCIKAHAEAFPTYPTVGWDIAITPEGPLLVEMNIQWVRPVGLPDEIFTGQTVYVDCILSHMRNYWPEQLPKNLKLL